MKYQGKHRRESQLRTTYASFFRFLIVLAIVSGLLILTAVIFRRDLPRKPETPIPFPTDSAETLPGETTEEITLPTETTAATEETLPTKPPETAEATVPQTTAPAQTEPAVPEPTGVWPPPKGPGDWRKNVLMGRDSSYEIPEGGYSSIVQSDSVYGIRVYSGEIKAVIFEGDTGNAPADCVDASMAQDGSVVAWVERLETGPELHIAANGGINGKLCEGLFCGFVSLERVDFGGCFHTEEAESMSRMFYGCWELQEVDGSQLVTDRVTSFREMFYGCSKLKSLDVRGWNTSRATDMGCMFYSCDSLRDLDVSGFQTGKVEQMALMFYDCPAENLNLSRWDLSSVKVYGYFMAENARVNGQPWEALFAPYQKTPTLTAKESGSWENGGYTMEIYGRHYATIRIQDPIFASKEFLSGEVQFDVNLYHSLENWKCYNLYFRMEGQKVKPTGIYIFNGSAANSYHPKSVEASVNQDVLTLTVYSNEVLRLGMDDLVEIRIGYHRNDEFIKLYSGEIS